MGIVAIFIVYVLFWFLGLYSIFSNVELTHSKYYPFMTATPDKRYLYPHYYSFFWNSALLLTMSHFVITASSIFWYYGRQ